MIVPASLCNINNTFFLRQYMIALPTGYLDAAKIDGCTYFGAYRRGFLPLSRTAIIANAIMLFMSAWNDYFGPLIFTHSASKQTVQVAIAMLNSHYEQQTDIPLVMAASLIAVPPALILFITCQKHFTDSYYLSKGYRIHEGIASHPLGPYHDNPHNPLAVRAGGDVVGLGHSSTVIGPDLTSRYLLCHNLNPDRTRNLNLDRLALHPDGSCLLGATTAPQPALAAPLFSDVPHDPEKWIIRYGVWSASKDGCESSSAFASVLTLPLPQEVAVEMHVQALSAATGRYGVRLSRGPDDLTICLSRAKNELTVELPDGYKCTFPL